MQDYFTSNNIKYIDYKDTAILRQFIDQGGRIMSKNKTRLSTKNQKKLALAIKRARLMALLPFIAQ